MAFERVCALSDVPENGSLRVELAADRDEVVGARVELVQPLGREEVQLAPVDAGVEPGEQ